jgi:redox-sensitive bicupin YhaK (pirin superfamily)
MEIFSYLVSGTVAHKDSMGNGRELNLGQIQLMSAGTGVTHSEHNPSRSEPLHLLQILDPAEPIPTPALLHRVASIRRFGESVQNSRDLRRWS